MVINVNVHQRQQLFHCGISMDFYCSTLSGFTALEQEEDMQFKYEKLQSNLQDFCIHSIWTTLEISFSGVRWRLTVFQLVIFVVVFMKPFNFVYVFALRAKLSRE